MGKPSRPVAPPVEPIDRPNALLMALLAGIAATLAAYAGRHRLTALFTPAAEARARLDAGVVSAPAFAVPDPPTVSLTVTHSDAETQIAFATPERARHD